jgi:hypothetical protein
VERTLGKHLKEGVVKQRGTPNPDLLLEINFRTSTFRERMTMERERSSKVRKLMVTKFRQDTLNRAPMDIHPRTKCNTCI